MGPKGYVSTCQDAGLGTVATHEELIHRSPSSSPSPRLAVPTIPTNGIDQHGHPTKVTGILQISKFSYPDLANVHPKVGLRDVDLVHNYYPLFFVVMPLCQA